MIEVLIAAILYLMAFASVEFFGRKLKISKELSRKFVHVAAGTSAAALAFVMSFSQIIALSLLFIPVMLLSKKLNFFSSIHEVSRHTYGEVYFPFSILITAALFPHRTVYIYGLLVMALSDGFASIFGQKYGRRKYKLWKGDKSYLGSAVFFAITVILGFAALISAGLPPIQALSCGALLALVLTLAEASLSFGLDNLVLPPLAGLLLFCTLRLLGHGL